MPNCLVTMYVLLNNIALLFIHRRYSCAEGVFDYPTNIEER